MKDNGEKRLIPKKNKMVNEFDIICPVCGSEVGLYDICDTCQWENSGEYNIDGGAMEMTLEEAIIRYELRVEIK